MKKLFVVEKLANQVKAIKQILLQIPRTERIAEIHFLNSFLFLLLLSLSVIFACHIRVSLVKMFLMLEYQRWGLATSASFIDQDKIFLSSFEILEKLRKAKKKVFEEIT